MKNNKARIPHLEINEVFYIKDDELKMKYGMVFLK